MKNKALFLMILLTSTNIHAADITVSAAASLTDAFKQIATQYQQKYPEDKIKLNTAASGVLLRQLEQGAPVDVLATADTSTMDKAQKKQLIKTNTRHNFAQNTLVLVTPKNGSHRFQSLADLHKAQRIAIGKPESVPAGAYAKFALEKQNLFNKLQGKMIYTQNVRQALDYVARGEVDVGFVYRTDAQRKSTALHTPFIVPSTAVIYPVAVTQQSKQPLVAQRFVDYLRSPQAQRILQSHGFARP